MKAVSYLTDEQLRKIKQIEIHTQRLLRGSLVGDSRSAVKGTGLDFDQIREYQQGDDVRFIDWRATARSRSLLVKQYIEERSRVVLIAVDVSGSGFLGSTQTIKHDIMAQVASVLALVTNSGKDKAGLILFSDTIELYIPPARGRGHVQRIMEAVFAFEPTSRKTDLGVAFKKLAELKRRDALAFVISDFITDQLHSPYISLVSKLYDLVAIRCLDPREHALPAVGFVPMQDNETGETLLVDLRSSHNLSAFLQERVAQQDALFKRYGIGLLDVENNEAFCGYIDTIF